MNPINNILVASDLSGDNQNVLVYASELAKKFGAKVYILHANYMPISASEANFINISVFEEDLNKSINDKFKQIEKDFFYSKFPEHEFICLDGSVEEIIEEVLGDKRIDLLIMGTEEPNAFMQILGSHSSHMARKSEVPLMIIPHNSSFKITKKILYACDLKKLSTHLELLNFIAQQYRAELHILTLEDKLHVLNHNELITGMIIDKLLQKSDAAHLYLKKDNTEDSILEYANSNDIDLLVLTPHHHNIWERITQKSITKNLLFHSEIPLLVLPE